MINLTGLVSVALFFQIMSGTAQSEDLMKMTPDFMGYNKPQAQIVTLNDFSFIQISAPNPVKIQKRKVLVTAYSSSPDETDDTPFETASGSSTRDGIVAANFLAFGTNIKIPDKFGNKNFTVEDRMAPRHKNRVDVWFPTKQQALEFGIKYLEIEIET